MAIASNDPTAYYDADAQQGQTPNQFQVIFSGGTGPQIKLKAEGIWIVGLGLASSFRSPAHQVSLFGSISPLTSDQGWYFWSEDGASWTGAVPAQLGGPAFSNGFTGISYANGCWLLEGTQTAASAPIVATLRDPRRPEGIILTPPGAFLGPSLANSAPLPPTHYDNPSGLFTVPISGGGIVLVQNTLPSAVVPDPDWPSIGQSGEASGGDPNSVFGFGTRGLVEVRIASLFSTILEPTRLTEDEVIFPGRFLTDFLQWRQVGASDWQQANALKSVLSGDVNPGVAGLTLRGLVWGPVKQTAVKLLKGSD